MQTKSALLSLLAALSLFALSLVCAAPAHAGHYRLDFTASNFHVPPTPNAPQIPPPQDTISGSILFSIAADSVFSQQNATLDWVSLAIGGHAYSASDVVGSVGPYQWSYTFGGALLGPNSAHSGTDDFVLVWSPNGLPNPFTFTYSVFSTASVTTLWTTNTGTVSVTQVPEPSTWALMLAGLGMVTLVARRKQKKTQQGA